MAEKRSDFIVRQEEEKEEKRKQKEEQRHAKLKGSNHKSTSKIQQAASTGNEILSSNIGQSKTAASSAGAQCEKVETNAAKIEAWKQQKRDEQLRQGQRPRKQRWHQY